MNAWVPKLIRADQAARVTAGGSQHIALGKDSVLPTLVETSWDGGQTWHDVTVSFAAFVAGELLTLKKSADGAAQPALGSQIRCNQDFYIMQED